MKINANRTHFIQFGLVVIFLITFCHADWQTIYNGSGYALKSVCFPVDAQTGWVVGYGASNNRLLKTMDGGENWIQQDAGVTSGLMGVFFRSNNDLGYAVGFDGTIIKTTNGGAEWTQQNSGVAADLHAIQFPVDNDTGFTVGDNGVILKTTNGGANWNPQNSGTTDWLTDLDFPADARTGYAVGHMCALKTTNGGLNWLDITDTTMYMGLEAVEFPTGDQVGFACGYDMFIFKTTDGGATWDSTRPFLTTEDYAAVHTLSFPVNEQVGYAGGTGFNIFKTTDAGDTWVEQPAPFGIVYSIIFPVDNDTGYASCDETHILKTTDGGNFICETVNSKSGKHELTVQPNPVRSTGRIPGQTQTLFYIFDVTGRQVGLCRGDGIGKNLKPGIYFAEAANSANQRIKFIKLR
jgi:photosystem II stability/assembly factor-like uncharacterized protein